MKTLILSAFISLSYLTYGQSGNWTKNKSELYANATTSSNSTYNHNSTRQLNSVLESKQTIITDLEIQKEIATHQNMEIEELLAENERLKQQFAELIIEFSNLKADVIALKEKIIE